MTEASPPRPRRAAILFLIVTDFLGAMGVGLVSPILPFMVARYEAPERVAFMVGMLAASYAAAAFLAAPVLGALSDHFGRRPVLVLSVLGSAVGYLMFGLAGATWMLLAGRLVDGLTAGNFSVVFAAVSDSTEPKDRARTLGYIGAAVGAGFITGPAIGSLLARLGVTAPLFFAAGVSGLNALLGLLVMPETRMKHGPRTPFTLARLNPLAELRAVWKMPAIRPLLCVGILFTLPFTMMGTLLSLLAKDSLSWSASGVSVIFILVGVADISVQGFVLGQLLKRIREERVGILGLALATLGLLAIGATALFSRAALLVAGVLLFASGEGIFTACLGSTISKAAGADDQGRVQGGSQGLQSLTQIAGPVLGGLLYARAHPAAPFIVGALFVGVAARVFALHVRADSTTAEIAKTS